MKLSTLSGRGGEGLESLYSLSDRIFFPLSLEIFDTGGNGADHPVPGCWEREKVYLAGSIYPGLEGRERGGGDFLFSTLISELLFPGEGEGEEKWLGSKSNGNSFVRGNYLAGKLPNLLIDYLTVELNISSNRADIYRLGEPNVVVSSG